MNKGRNPVQKSGNNTLILVAGILLVIFLGLLYVGSLRQSSVDQLIESAAPDSSTFANDSFLAEPTEVEAPVLQPERSETKLAVAKDTIEASSDKASNNSDSLKSKSATPTQASQSFKIEGNGTEKTYFYKIRKGDTMYKIAAKFGNKPSDVLTLNGLSEMSLQADKEIKVKVKDLYTAANGEGLNAISEKFNVPAKSIQVANDMKSDAIQSGFQLIIPLK